MALTARYRVISTELDGECCKVELAPVSSPKGQTVEGTKLVDRADVSPDGNIQLTLKNRAVTEQFKENQNIKVTFEKE